MIAYFYVSASVFYLGSSGLVVDMFFLGSLVVSMSASDWKESCPK